MYSPDYSPGQTAKYPKNFYATLAKWRIALPPLVSNEQQRLAALGKGNEGEVFVWLDIFAVHQTCLLSHECDRHDLPALIEVNSPYTRALNCLKHVSAMHVLASEVELSSWKQF